MDLKAARKNVLAFASMLLIDTPTGLVRLGTVLNDFQRDFFQAIGPALERLCGRDVPACCQRFWEERSRGHAKSSDLAIVILWLLIFNPRKWSGIGAAGDKEQARLLRDAIETLLRLYPELAKVIDCQAYKIINKHTGSTFEIISSDAGSSYGVTPDLIIADEVCHWEPAAVDLWHSLLSSAAKKSNCVLACITNAGWKETEWWKLREAVRVDPAWRFNRLPGCVASWISAEQLEEQARLLPPAVYRRLWGNEWSDGTGNDALDGADIQRAVTLTGPLAAAERGWSYVAGLDLGVKHDSSALVVLGKHTGSVERKVTPPRPLPSTFRALADLDFYDAPRPKIEYKHTPATGKLRLAAVKIWTPQNGRVELAAIEAAVLDLHSRFNFRLHYDPYQAAYLAERLARKHVYCSPTNFTGGNLTEMAAAMLDAFRERQLELYPEPQLLADLKAMRIVERSYGFRLEAGHAPDGTPHGDAMTALAIALHAAKSISTNSAYAGNRELVYN